MSIDSQEMAQNSGKKRLAIAYVALIVLILVILFGVLDNPSRAIRSIFAEAFVYLLAAAVFSFYKKKKHSVHVPIRFNFQTVYVLLGLQLAIRSYVNNTEFVVGRNLPQEIWSELLIWLYCVLFAVLPQASLRIVPSLLLLLKLLPPLSLDSSLPFFVRQTGLVISLVLVIGDQLENKFDFDFLKRNRVVSGAIGGMVLILIYHACFGHYRTSAVLQIFQLALMIYTVVSITQGENGAIGRALLIPFCIIHAAAFSILIFSFQFVNPFMGLANVDWLAVYIEWTALLMLSYSSEKINYKGAALLLITAGIFALALVRLKSRSTVPVVIFGAALACIIFTIPEKWKSKKLFAILFVLGLASGILLAYTMLPVTVHDLSMRLRYALWDVAWVNIKVSTETILVGSGNFGPYWWGTEGVSYISSVHAGLLENHPEFVFGYPHSDYYMILYGLGIAGLLLTAVLGYAAVRSVSNCKGLSATGLGAFASLVGLWIHGIVDQSTATNATGVLFWISLSLVVSLKGKVA